MLLPGSRPRYRINPRALPNASAKQSARSQRRTCAPSRRGSRRNGTYSGRGRAEQEPCRPTHPRASQIKCHPSVQQFRALRERLDGTVPRVVAECVAVGCKTARSGPEPQLSVEVAGQSDSRTMSLVGMMTVFGSDVSPASRSSSICAAASPMVLTS